MGALLLAAAPARAADWSRWRGPLADGHAAPDERLPEPLTPTIAWQRPLGFGYPAVVVAGGSAVTMYTADQSDFLVALDAATGAVAGSHEFQLDGVPIAVPIGSGRLRLAGEPRAVAIDVRATPDGPVVTEAWSTTALRGSLAAAEGNHELARIEVFDRSGHTYPTFADGRVFVRKVRDIAAVSLDGSRAGDPPGDGDGRFERRPRGYAGWRDRGAAGGGSTSTTSAMSSPAGDTSTLWRPWSGAAPFACRRACGRRAPSISKKPLTRRAWATACSRRIVPRGTRPSRIRARASAAKRSRTRWIAPKLARRPAPASTSCTWRKSSAPTRRSASTRSASRQPR